MEWPHISQSCPIEHLHPVCVYHHTCPVPLHKSQLEEFSWAVSRCQSLELGLILFAMQRGGSFPCLGMCKVAWRSPVGTG